MLARVATEPGIPTATTTAADWLIAAELAPAVQWKPPATAAAKAWVPPATTTVTGIPASPPPAAAAAAKPRISVATAAATTTTRFGV
jgi:hypothetical protein